MYKLTTSVHRSEYVSKDLIRKLVGTAGAQDCKPLNPPDTTATVSMQLNYQIHLKTRDSNCSDSIDSIL